MIVATGLIKTSIGFGKVGNVYLTTSGIHVMKQYKSYQVYLQAMQGRQHMQFVQMQDRETEEPTNPNNPQHATVDKALW